MIFRPAQYIDLLCRKPGVFPNAARSYFRSAVLGRVTLKIVHVALTYECNAECSHCAVSRMRRADVPELAPAEMAACVRECVRLGALCFEFTGGEPLLYGGLPEVVANCSPRRTLIGITTNALLLTRDSLRTLKSAGVDVVQVSIDSPCPEAHDRRRGVEGSYERAVRSIELIKRAGLSPIISTILHPAHLAEAEDVVRLARRLGARVVVNPAVKTGSWAENERITADATYVRVYRRLLREPHVRWAGHVNFPFEACPCGREGIYVTPYGDVTPCQFMPIAYGNIRTEPLAAIWKRMYSNLPASRMRRKGCIAGLDRDFSRRYLEPLRGARGLPVEYSRHPGGGA